MLKPKKRTCHLLIGWKEDYLLTIVVTIIKIIKVSTVIYVSIILYLPSCISR